MVSDKKMMSRLYFLILALRFFIALGRVSLVQFHTIVFMQLVEAVLRLSIKIFWTFQMQMIVPCDMDLIELALWIF